MDDQTEQTQSTDKVFAGFSSPAFTQTPNVFFDELMPDLKESELKVLLYIIRRTWGFAGKQAGDTISINQLCSGIVSKDGERLDRGTGLSRAGVTKALVSLRIKGIITRMKNRDTVRGDMPSTYRLRMYGEPLDIGEEPPDVPESPLVDPRVSAGRLPPSPLGDPRVYTERLGESPLVDPQYIVKQNKDIGQKPFEFSNDHHLKQIDYSATRMALQPYIADFAREFNDQAKQSSTLSRAVNLCNRANMDADEFIDIMLAARAKTKEHSASITSTDPTNQWGKKAAMPYFFGVIEDMLGFKQEKSG